MPRQPMAEVFGFRIDAMTSEADRHLQHRLCPFNNKVPSCTKDKANDPLGVCSIYDGTNITITCPVRFRQDWLIATDAAAFFFPSGTKWTSLTEIRLHDRYGKSAGNIDVVLVSYDEEGKITDFGALEVQAVYISGNIRKPFAEYMSDPANHVNLDWSNKKDYPRADYLSSSRKRLAPQLIYKGGILNAWGRKMAVAVDRGFFETLPTLSQVSKDQADVAWLVYQLQASDDQGRYKLVHSQTVYTQFTSALQRITNADPGSENDFLKLLQRKLDEKQLGRRIPPDTSSLLDAFAQDEVEE
ncbi:NotI family restriction endonuclease [Candidatus Chloroploca mongolica]|nr:NotI family restriction endonuclease [Candidatus Chloroploca mongolica]